MINASFCFSGMSLNHSMVSLVYFHRFTLVACVISWFIRSRMFLLMMPISNLHGLMSLQVGLLMKSGLWSFSVINESLGAEASMRSASSSFSAIILSLKMIMSGTFGFVFLYVFVTFLSTTVTTGSPSALCVGAGFRGHLVGIY